MLAEKRFSEILRLVDQKKTVTVQELTEYLNTSESTIRRDLTTLDQMGRLKKVYGGATAPETATITKEDRVIDKENRNTEEKRRIGKAAAALIESDDFVFVDAGTTTAMLVEYIQPNGATFVTNAINHAKVIAQKGCKVYLLGGEFKATTEAVIGERAIDDLGRYNFTKGFFGSNSISLKAGFSTPDVSEAMVKSSAMDKCRSKFVLADPSKFNTISSVTFCEFSRAEVITTAVDDAKFQAMDNVMEVDKN